MYKFAEHPLNRQRGVGPEVYPIWIHQYKLAMCLIPKNAITMWKMVLLRMIEPQNDQKWWIFDTKIHANRALKKRRLTPPWFAESDIDIIYEEESSHFVVTVRDPLERALSGYLHFQWSFKAAQEFKDFPSYLFKMRDNQKAINQHVREQHLFCDLDRAHSRYQEFAFSNISDRRRLLDSVGEGIWDEIGATGWHPAAHLNVPQTLRKFPQIMENATRWEHHQSLINFSAPSDHSMFARAKVTSYYSNVTLIAEMMRFYRRDYQLFDILTVPDWICEIVDGDTLKEEVSILLVEIEALSMEKYPPCYGMLKQCVQSEGDGCVI